jgi:uncharacterized protein GlcG (DUF336 family)
MRADSPMRVLACLAGAVMLAGATAQAAECPVTRDQLVDALKRSVKPTGGPSNGGFDNHEWAAVVNRKGVVCAIAFSGTKPDDQWLGSRAIAAEKANTANALSLKGAALSTANLWGATQPGAPLFGLQASNPADPAVLYAGDPAAFGGEADPFLGKSLGGVIVFGGGLALYDGNDVVGGLGASGDSSCADHNIAWRIRQMLGLHKVPKGVGPDKTDEIVYDVQPSGKSVSGFGHPQCGGKEAEIAAEMQAGYLPEWARQMQKP